MTKNSSAFTMMEILMVLFIVGFLFAFLGPRIYRMMFKSDISITKLKMAKLKDSLLEYKQDMGHFPKRAEGGIAALLVRPAVQGNEKWEGPYVDSEDDLMDKWGDEFEYNAPPQRYKKFRFFEIISAGGEQEDAQEIAEGV
jgi:general secretion pathway protein G